MIVRVLNDTDVAQHTLRREKSGLLVKNGAEEFVGGAKALHQNITVTVMHKLDSLGHSLELLEGFCIVLIDSKLTESLQIGGECALAEVEILIDHLTRIAGLKDADPSVPLAFVGVRTMEGHPVLTEKADVYGRSFFEWIYSPDHPTSSTIPALRLLTAYDGRQYEGITSPEQEREAVAAAGDMPAYPSPGFVRQEPGMVIIKLSNP